MSLSNRLLLIVFVVFMTACSETRSIDAEDPSSQVNESTKLDGSIERAEGMISVGELCSRIRFQTGFTRGYGVSKWQNTILSNEPAVSILSVAKRRPDEVMNILISKMDDYTIIKDCVHHGRSSSNPYTVSDVACYLLVQLHTHKSIEAVVQEMQKRKEKMPQSWGSIAWAIDYYEVIK